MEKKEFLRKIPAIDKIINSSEFNKYRDKYPKDLLIQCIKDEVDDLRKQILNSSEDKLYKIEISREIVLKGAVKKARRLLEPSLRRVINATGTVIHTNLGRAPLSSKIREHLWEVAGRYSTLEYDVEQGTRGSRYSHIESILCRLTGAEAAFVVNNNAGAVLLVLSALTKNKEVIVSRGELVEIGGLFRIPEIIAQSGAKLIEVGTTNKTYLEDYRKAITENTAALLKVHTSNYRICGFSHQVKGAELVRLAQQYNLISIEDLGSGTFIDFTTYGLSYEPTVTETVKTGIDIVTFSGDKLLGGPQGGIIVGKREYIERIKLHPLTRALRVDKMTLAALEMTLKLYLEDIQYVEHLPVINMITMPIEKLTARANRLLALIKNKVTETDAKMTVVDDFSMVGGGAFPTDKLPTKTVAIKPERISSSEVEKRLRQNEPPVIARIKDEMIVFDVRTLFDDDLKIIADSLGKILGGD